MRVVTSCRSANMIIAYALGGLDAFFVNPNENIAECKLGSRQNVVYCVRVASLWFLRDTCVEQTFIRTSENVKYETRGAFTSSNSWRRFDVSRLIRIDVRRRSAVLNRVVKWAARGRPAGRRVLAITVPFGWYIIPRRIPDFPSFSRWSPDFLRSRYTAPESRVKTGHKTRRRYILTVQGLAQEL